MSLLDEAIAAHGGIERWIDGLLVATSRRVTPSGLPAPTLVSIEIEAFSARDGRS
ncbi:MAG TPA: hypothetical protein VGH09_01345 [Solirubrobacteraceae bacterium]|jgi:hypothetical protein